MASFTALAPGASPLASSSRCKADHAVSPRLFTSSAVPSRALGRASSTAPSGLCRLSSSSRFNARRLHVQAAAQETSTEAAGPVTDQDWEEKVLKSPVPVIVDFWAPWCGPCRMIAPMIDEIAVEYGDKIRAFKLNTDESPSIATDYGIRSIPTVMVFKDGKKMDVVIGAVPKSTLVQSFDKFVD